MEFVDQLFSLQVDEHVDHKDYHVVLPQVGYSAESQNLKPVMPTILPHVSQGDRADVQLADFEPVTHGKRDFLLIQVSQ